jgi:hypothetical protein
MLSQVLHYQFVANIFLWDVTLYVFFEIQDDVTVFYYMLPEHNTQNSVLGLMIYDDGECGSLGSIRDNNNAEYEGGV